MFLLFVFHRTLRWRSPNILFGDVQGVLVGGGGIEIFRYGMVSSSVAPAVPHVCTIELTAERARYTTARALLIHSSGVFSSNIFYDH